MKEQYVAHHSLITRSLPLTSKTTWPLSLPPPLMTAPGMAVTFHPLTSPSIPPTSSSMPTTAS